MNTTEIFGPGFSSLPEQEKVRRAATELEAVVIAQILGTLRKTVPDGGLLESSLSQDIFRSMLDEEIARVAAERSPFGLAAALAESIEKQFKIGEDSTETATEEPSNSLSGVAGRSWRG